MRGWLIIATAGMLGVVGAHRVRADGALAELDAGSVPGSSAAPGTAWSSEKLAGTWDASSHWQVRVDLASTHLSGGAADESRGGVLLASASAVYMLDDHWTLRASGGWSPQSTERAAVTVDGQGLFSSAAAATVATAQIGAASSSMSIGAGVDYDSAGSGDHSLGASLSASATYFQSQQEILSVDGPSGQMLGPQSLRAQCQVTTCSGDLAAALWPQWTQLGQFTFAGSVTDTIRGATDVSLDAAYFVYGSDPTQLGYFALATIGRGTLGSAAGVAPMLGSVTPSVSHRWGALGASASLSYVDYVGDGGTDVATSVRVQYRLKLAGARRVKLFGKAAIGWHLDSSGATVQLTRADSAGLGVQYSW